MGECGGERLCRRELVGGGEEAWERKGGSRGSSQLAMACCTDCAVQQCKGIYSLVGGGARLALLLALLSYWGYSW